MSVVIPHKAIDAISQSKDPRQAILDTIGNLDDLHIKAADLCLIGIYVRPEKTTGGIIRPPTNIQEDIWQGKVGLLLKVGPNAFRDANGELYEEHAKVGEWVVFDVNDARSLQVRGVPCRWVRDIHIKATVDDPFMIF